MPTFYQSLPALSLFLSRVSGSAEAGCRAEWQPAAFGGGPEGRGPSSDGGSRPGRGAEPRPAPTAPHQVTPLILLHATTLRPSARCAQHSASGPAGRHPHFIKTPQYTMCQGNRAGVSRHMLTLHMTSPHNAGSVCWF